MNSILGNRPASPQPSPGAAQQDISTMVRQFNQFRNSFRGDPKQAVMQMLSSGQINNTQLNQVMQMARQFRGILK